MGFKGGERGHFDDQVGQLIQRLNDLCSHNKEGERVIGNSSLFSKQKIKWEGLWLLTLENLEKRVVVSRDWKQLESLLSLPVTAASAGLNHMPFLSSVSCECDRVMLSHALT